MDENDQHQRVMPAPPKEIRLRDRDDRPPPSVDRGNSYDSRGGRDGRDWHQDRDRDRDREPPYKRSGDSNWQRADAEKRLGDGRSHRAEPSGRDREWMEKENIVIKRKDAKTSESETMEQDRPSSRNSRSSLKEESNKEKGGPFPTTLLTEIVSWADEPGEEDMLPPSGTSDRGFSEERRLPSNKAHGTSSHHHHHAPAPIPRDRLEADVRAENKQSNFVSLRRLQGREGQPVPAQAPTATRSDGRGEGGGSSATYSAATHEEQDKKQPQQQRPPSLEGVQNVWATRSKSREQVPEPAKREIVEEKLANADGGEDSDRKGSGKDLRNRSAPAASKSGTNSNTSSTSNNATASGARRGGLGQRRRESNSRYSDSYDEYYEEDGVHYRQNEQPHGEKKQQQQQQHVEPPRKSKSPDDDESQKKDHNARGGAGRNLAPASSAGGPPFRNNRRGGGGRGGFEEEEQQHGRGGVKESQPRPPRFQQQEDNAAPASSRSDHKIKEEQWDGHSEHSDSVNNRSNRRGGGRGVGAPAVGGDRRVRGKPDHNDYYKEEQPAASSMATKDVPSAANEDKDHDRKPAPKERPLLIQEDGVKRLGESRGDRRNEPKDNRDNRDRGDRNRNDRDRDRDRGGRNNDDRGNRGGQQPSKSADSQRYEQRPKSNLPPRLAKLDNRHKIQKTDNAEGHEAPSSQTKESTPPVQQQMGGPSWDKAGSGSASSPGLTNAMASMALTDAGADKVVADETAVILDGTTPPAQTIIFENTNFKSTSAELAKGRGTPPSQGPKGPSIQQQKMSDAKTSVPATANANAANKGDPVQLTAIAAAMGKLKLGRT